MKREKLKENDQQECKVLEKALHGQLTIRSQAYKLGDELQMPSSSLWSHDFGKLFF